GHPEEAAARGVECPRAELGPLELKRVVGDRDWEDQGRGATEQGVRRGAMAARDRQYGEREEREQIDGGPLKRVWDAEREVCGACERRHQQRGGGCHDAEGRERSAMAGR